MFKLIRRLFKSKSDPRFNRALERSEWLSAPEPNDRKERERQEETTKRINDLANEEPSVAPPSRRRYQPIAEVPEVLKPPKKRPGRPRKSVKVKGSSTTH